MEFMRSQAESWVGEALNNGSRSRIRACSGLGPGRSRPEIVGNPSRRASARTSGGTLGSAVRRRSLVVAARVLASSKRARWRSEVRGKLISEAMRGASGASISDSDSSCPGRRSSTTSVLSGSGSGCTGTAIQHSSSKRDDRLRRTSSPVATSAAVRLCKCRKPPGRDGHQGRGRVGKRRSIGAGGLEHEHVVCHQRQAAPQELGQQSALAAPGGGGDRYRAIVRCGKCGGVQCLIAIHQRNGEEHRVEHQSPPRRLGGVGRSAPEHACVGGEVMDRARPRGRLRRSRPGRHRARNDNLRHDLARRRTGRRRSCPPSRSRPIQTSLGRSLATSPTAGAGSVWRGEAAASPTPREVSDQ